MTLDATRTEMLKAIEEGNLDKAKTAAEAWFMDIKAWEKGETFKRAFDDGRMTARTFDPGSKLKSFELRGDSAGKMNLDTSFTGHLARLKPENFENKKKNALGLHDLSAVLLRTNVPISKQLFSNSGIKAAIFMPIPLEADLKAFDVLAECAKSNRTNPIYGAYLGMRARFTRIKFGSDNDMHSGFFNLKKVKPNTDIGDGKMHLRYGTASLVGKKFEEEVLTQRHLNALNYKSKILDGETQANNEVSLTIREYAGTFPLFGEPTTASGPPFEMAYMDFATKKPVDFGKLMDNGELTKS